MVYIKAWADFQDQAEALYSASPAKTRYVVKYRAVDGKLVLKLTDDVTCLKFKTMHSVYLGRFDALNLALLQKMQNRIPPPPPATPAAPSITLPHPSNAPAGSLLAPPMAKSSSLAPSAASPGGSRAGTPGPEDGPAGTTGTVGGGTKKKPKKKKK